jgi:hypothetical protein
MLRWCAPREFPDNQDIKHDVAMVLDGEEPRVLGASLSISDPHKILPSTPTYELAHFYYQDGGQCAAGRYVSYVISPNSGKNLRPQEAYGRPRRASGSHD